MVVSENSDCENGEVPKKYRFKALSSQLSDFSFQFSVFVGNEKLKADR